MSVPRIHVTPDRWVARVRLLPAEVHHLAGVLRLASGAHVEVFDGEGGLCPARLVREGRHWVLELGAKIDRPDGHDPVLLGVAVLKGKKLDLVVRMATELGVNAIHFFSCTRSVPRLEPARWRSRVARLTAIARQASRQCGRASVPRLAPCLPFHETVATASSPVRVLLHQTPPAPALPDLLDDHPDGERLVLVGPEGGFTEDECEAARHAGFEVARLDLPILRAETAAIAAAVYASRRRKIVAAP